jgi:iron uptake system component EfeO
MAVPRTSAIPARSTAVAAVAAAAALAVALAGCSTDPEPGGSSESGGKGDGAVAVAAGDTSCKVSRSKFPAGHVKLNVRNTGSKTTEVYLYAPGDRIVTERENIGPGTRAEITAEVKAGEYQIACKPGMTGKGIRKDVTATGGGAAVKKRDPRLDKAVAGYRAYAQAQADETLPAVRKFADAVKSGDLAKAKELYAPSRIGWERTEPVAESFGDIDPKVDVRADGLEKGQEWTGWHRLEKALWQDKKITAKEKDYAERLVTDLKDWQKRVGRADITPTGMANGAKELLDEVASGKVTGEEERYSHTDLVDFQANVEGADKSFRLLRAVAAKNDPALAEELDKQFKAMFKLLATHRQGKGFVSYDTVGKAERKKLQEAVDALAEPLSRLAAAVTK